MIPVRLWLFLGLLEITSGLDKGGIMEIFPSFKILILIITKSNFSH